MKRPLAAAILTLGAHLSAGCAVFNRPLPDGARVSVRGVVTDVAPAFVELRTKQGYVVQIRVDSATRFVARNQVVSRECAVTGTRLDARALVESGSWKATDVTIFSGACARRQP